MSAASKNENPEIIVALIKAGADIKAEDKDGDTALTLAAGRNNNPEVMYQVGLLFAKGDGVKKNQREAVEWFEAAAQKGHKAARNELAKRGICNNR